MVTRRIIVGSVIVFSFLNTSDAQAICKLNLASSAATTLSHKVPAKVTSKESPASPDSPSPNASTTPVKDTEKESVKGNNTDVKLDTKPSPSDKIAVTGNVATASAPAPSPAVAPPPAPAGSETLFNPSHTATLNTTQPPTSKENTSGTPAASTQSKSVDNKREENALNTENSKAGNTSTVAKVSELETNAGLRTLLSISDVSTNNLDTQKPSASSQITNATAIADSKTTVSGIASQTAQTVPASINDTVGGTTTVLKDAAKSAVDPNVSVSDNTTEITNVPLIETKAVDPGMFACDANFYNQWESLGIKCGGVSIDVQAAMNASSCVIYNGVFLALPGSSCVSFCSFPACESGKWDYNSQNGLASTIYADIPLQKFMNGNAATSFSNRIAGDISIASKGFKPTKQCSYSSDSSFGDCGCDAYAGDSMSKLERKEARKVSIDNGIIPLDKTTNLGKVAAPLTTGLASTTIAVTGVATVASTITAGLNGVGSASTSFAAAGTHVAVATIEVCQFMVLINQLNLPGKSAALAQFGVNLAPSTFNFRIFGSLKKDDLVPQLRRRLTAQDPADSGIAMYSRYLGLNEDMLFLATLASVATIIASILILFGILYILSGLCMSRKDFMDKFFDRMVGLLILILMLSQYTIGVTATFEIYRSIHTNDTSSISLDLAIASLVFLAVGIIFYGFVVVKRYENDIRDVGTSAHVTKSVCLRYGPIYDEYKFKHRFFFAPKLMLALISGCVTGYVGLRASMQIGILLAANILFFMYLEIRSPYHSRFVQTTTSFVTLMRVAILILTFFLLSAAAADGFPSDLQNGVSLAIIGLNVFMIMLLMIRGMYAFYRKYKLQQEGKVEDEGDHPDPDEYFKPDHVPHGPPTQHYDYTQAAPGTQYVSVRDDDYADNLRMDMGERHPKDSRRRGNDAVEL